MMEENIVGVPEGNRRGIVEYMIKIHCLYV